MTNANPFAAKILETSASAYGAYAANLLLERRPEIGERSGGAAFHSWKTHLTQRVKELADALAEGEPALFVSRVDWSKTAFGARDVSPEDLAASLECLAEVLREELPAPAREPVSDYVDQAIRAVSRPAEPEDPALDPASPAGRLALEYLQAVLEGEARRAVHLVVDAVESGLDVEDAYMDVLLPAQREVGRMWHLAEVSVAEEHLVTMTTRRLMAILCHRASPEASNGKTVVSAAVAGNVHDVGVRAVSDFFEMAGWRAVCLGADVPATDVAAATECFDARLVVLSASLSHHLKRVRETIEAIRGLEGGSGVKVLVGGIAFAEAPELWRRLGADGYARTAREAVALGDSLA